MVSLLKKEIMKSYWKPSQKVFTPSSAENKRAKEILQTSFLLQKPTKLARILLLLPELLKKAQK